MTYLDAVTLRTVDNRDQVEMLRYLAARVEAMTRTLAVNKETR